MSDGRSKQLVKQAGEHLVAAELAKRGFLATPFAGNVPGFDVIAIGEGLKAIPVQVKTISSSSWQLKASRFIDISFVGKKQRVTGISNTVSDHLIYVFVKIATESDDRFYIIRAKDLAGRIKKNYINFLYRFDNVRPKNHKSTHASINETHLADCLNKWDIFSE
ncbi:hypothetical protein A7E78_03995 [Syntrophotalea acetylenivorans]|uniref:PD(D/E)XK endonuclease domain-containing protein n=1 Tax=Syntrophotalea acetylenivorans TaxID=1842532 RepID=A0A1L3GN29_9BACT|nr:hypothetical protein [Syntrophotalea acetylenivorans]APG27068.1 hypothetical protein A7E78_03995 [Syntrophotalea acetylenivorans]